MSSRSRWELLRLCAQLGLEQKEPFHAGGKLARPRRALTQGRRSVPCPLLPRATTGWVDEHGNKALLLPLKNTDPA